MKMQSSDVVVAKVKAGEGLVGEIQTIKRHYMSHDEEDEQVIKEVMRDLKKPCLFGATDYETDIIGPSLKLGDDIPSIEVGDEYVLYETDLFHLLADGSEEQIAIWEITEPIPMSVFKTWVGILALCLEDDGEILLTADILDA